MAAWPLAAPGKVANPTANVPCRGAHVVRVRQLFREPAASSADVVDDSTLMRQGERRWCDDGSGGLLGGASCQDVRILLGKTTVDAPPRHPRIIYQHPLIQRSVSQRLGNISHTTAHAAAMDDKDNANPTILNPSDLPSRRSEGKVKSRNDGGTGLFDGLIPHYSYLSDPFDEPLSASDSDDEGAVEGIDEQEIYGMLTLTCLPHSPAAPALAADHVHDRPHLHHLRPRAPTLARLSGCRQSAGHSHPPTHLAAFVHQHRCRRDHPDHYPLLARYRHWPGRARAARASPASALPPGRAHQEGHPQYGRAGQ